MQPIDAVPRFQEVLFDYPTLDKAAFAVAAESNVGKEALKRAYHRHRTDAGHVHGNSTLTAQQDATLVGVVQAFSINNLPMSTRQIADLVQTHWRKGVSLDWVQRWVGAHRRLLSLRACTAVADKRAGPQVFCDVQAFCGELELFLTEHSFLPDAVFNYDETRVVQRGGRLTTHRVVFKDRDNAVSTRHNTLASLLTFVAASGTVFFSVYELKAKFGDGTSATVNFSMEKAPTTTRSAWPRFFCWNDTGYLNAVTFRSVVDHFAAEWTVRNPGRQALLFGDRLGRHMQVATIQAALNKGCFLFYLPPNSSDINQPLDEAPFANQKSITVSRSEQGNMDAVLTGTSARDTLLHCAYWAERHSSTPADIKGAFLRLGLWPFNSAVMLARTSLALGRGPPCESIHGDARDAAAVVIRQATERVADVNKRAVRGKAVVERNILQSPQSLLDMDAAEKAAQARRAAVRARAAAEMEAKRAAREVHAAEKVVARANNTCRVCRTRVRRGGES